MNPGHQIERIDEEIFLRIHFSAITCHLSDSDSIEREGGAHEIVGVMKKIIGAARCVGRSMWKWCRLLHDDGRRALGELDPVVEIKIFACGLLGIGVIGKWNLQKNFDLDDVGVLFFVDEGVGTEIGIVKACAWDLGWLRQWC